MPRPSVLIVDDQVGDLRWLLDLIHNRGHDVVLTSNEKAARLRLRAVKDGEEFYVLAIIDVMVATRDPRDLVDLDDKFFADSRDTGIRLCRYAREELKLTETELPIICLTIRNDDQVQRAMAELGIPLYDRDDSDPDKSVRTVIEQRLGPRRPTAGQVTDSPLLK